MKVEIKKLPKSEIELAIKLDESELEPYAQKAARNLSQSHPVKGFRPGSVPAEVLEKKIGRERVFSQTVDLAVKETYVKAILEHKLQPVGEPKMTVSPAPPHGGLDFRVNVAVLPEISLPNYRALRVKKETVALTDKEIDSALKTLQKSRAVYATVTRPAAKGDRVEIDFTASLEGKPIENGESKQHPLILGEGHFIKGFEEELVGLKEGEKKSFSLRASQEYHHSKLADKKIDFDVTMRLVQSVSLPPLDDKLAQSVGKFSNLAELEGSIREGLHEEKDLRGREKTRLKLVEKIIEASPTPELPEVLVEQEIEKMEQELNSSLARMGLDQAGYLAHIKKSPADLREHWRPQAEKRVKAALVLAKIAEAEGIFASDQEVEARINELVKLAPPEEFGKIDLGAFRGYVRGLIRNERVLEHLEREMVDPVSSPPLI